MRSAYCRACSKARTTGTPIGLLIENTDQRSKDYSEIAKTYRPGHADYAYDAKYGLRDYRGGGRSSSARETAMRVAAGAVARRATRVIPEVSTSSPMSPRSAAMPSIRAISMPRRLRAIPSGVADAGGGETRWPALVDEARKAGPLRHWARWSNASPPAYARISADPCG